MFWASLICFLIALIAIEHGEMFMLGFFGGIGVLLMYLHLTKAKREAEKLKRIRQQKIADGQARFGNSRLVRTVISECKVNLSQGFSCDVCYDYIKTPVATHNYDALGLAKLDKKGTELLAYYIGSEVAGDDFIVDTKTKLVGGVSNSYSGYVGSDGSISISRDCSAEDIPIGHNVHSTYKKPDTPPKQAW